MKDQIFGVLQRVGRAFMLPLAILPVAGLLLGIGGSFSNATMLQTYGLYRLMGPGTVFEAIFQVMNHAGNIIFANLPLIFSIGIAIGMAKKEKEVAALAAAIAFLIMHASIAALIAIHGGEEAMLEGAVTDVCGIMSLQMGVFGGILVGIGVAALHNRFYRIELPQVLSFFGGTRFVPIISALVYTGVGILMFFIWPPIQRGIYAVGNLVLNSGYFGTWIYGLMERLLIPFGLHHVFYLPFWQTGVGGTLEVGGKLIEGAQNIFFAQLADPATEKFAVSATRFMSGKFPMMIFGLPGAAFAMYQTARPEKRKAAGGLLLSAALTSMLTGITEPLEFTFLFVAPMLYGIHCVFAGFAYMLMHMCNVGVGMTFSGGLIDLFLFGVLQGNARTNWIWIPIVGAGYFIVYYVIFRTLIVKLDLKTPGRDLSTGEVKLYRRSDVEARKNGDSGNLAGEAGSEGGRDAGADPVSALITRGLGGKSNISDVDCCATRLRCTVRDGALVQDDLLRRSGASGVIHKGKGVQIIYGPRVTVIKSNLEDYLESGAEDTESGGPEGQQVADGSGEQMGSGRGTMNGGPDRIVISSPVTGIAAELSTAPDEAFAQKMMGDGALVTPREDVVYAPEDGTVEFVFDTKHAVGFLTDTGISLLIHVGIDTVSLQGKGFVSLVSAGERVEKGTPLLKLNLPYLKKHALSLATPVLCTELAEHQQVRLLAQGEVKAGDPLYEVIG